jgi:hypothetical protein
MSWVVIANARPKSGARREGAAKRAAVDAEAKETDAR